MPDHGIDRNKPVRLVAKDGRKGIAVYSNELKKWVFHLMVAPEKHFDWYWNDINKTHGTAPIPGIDMLSPHWVIREEL